LTKEEAKLARADSTCCPDAGTLFFRRKPPFKKRTKRL